MSESPEVSFHRWTWQVCPVDGSRVPRPQVAISAAAIEEIEKATNIQFDQESWRRLEMLVAGRVMYVLGLTDYGTGPLIRLPPHAHAVAEGVCSLAQDLLSAMKRCDQVSNGKSSAVFDRIIGRRIGVSPLHAVEAIAEVYKQAFPSVAEENHIGRGIFIRSVRDQVFQPLIAPKPITKAGLTRFLVAINTRILVPLDKLGIQPPDGFGPLPPKRKGRSKRPSAAIGSYKAIEGALSREVAEHDKKHDALSTYWESAPRPKRNHGASDVANAIRETMAGRPPLRRRKIDM